MNLVTFPQANANFHAPPGFTESQVATAPAYMGQAQRGSVDGARLIVTAWKPTAEELADLNAGGLVYLSVLGDLPPHFLTTQFEQAIDPA